MWTKLTAGLLVAVLARLAVGEVTITVGPPEIERRTFDRANPPRDMPKLTANEAAITRSHFLVDTRIAADVVDRKRVGDEFQASLKVQGVRMKVSLSIIIWLPDDAVPKLVNHEEGHRILAEHFYKDAERVAKGHAEALVGRVVTGRGGDFQSAGDTALQKAAEEVGQQYLGEIDLPCGRAQELYDQITEHGTNAVKEAKAIEESIRRATAKTP